MSALFALDQKGADELELQALNNDAQDLSASPKYWSGLGKSIGLAVPRSFANIARAGQAALESTGSTIARGEALDSAMQRNASLEEIKQIADPEQYKITYDNDLVRNAVDYWTPNANEVGHGSQIAGSLIEGGIQLTIGLGNPTLLAASQGVQTKEDLQKQGVDSTTATEAGLISSAAAIAGVKVPIVGSGLATRLLSGAVGNAAVGTASRAAESKVLSDYPDIAQSPTLSTLSEDALMGLLFGGVHHAFSPKLKPSDIDAIQSIRNAKHFQEATTPGEPLNVAAEVGHQTALGTALDQLSKGEKVEVGDAIAKYPEAQFKRSPETSSLPAALRDIPRDSTLSPEDSQIEGAFIDRVQNAPRETMDAYAALPETMGGKVLNTDIARELDPNYLSDRTKSAAVHESASALVKALYAEKLQESPKEGELPLVVFSAGGTGAGKSTGLDLTDVAAQAQIVYDSNMNSIKSSVSRIEQALKAKKDVQILYTYRDPVEALKNGALPRAMKQEGQFGSGRTVPLTEHAKTHTGSAEVIRQLADKYKDDPRVTITAIDNSLGKGNAKITDLSMVPDARTAHTDLEGALHETLDQQLQAGKISESIYRVFGGKNETLLQRVPESEAKPIVQSAARPGGSEKAQPEITAAEQIALETPDAKIRIGTDGDGNPIMSTVAEALAQFKTEYADDLNSAQAYQAAVTCFLQAGA